MRLRKPCKHGRYEEHRVGSWSNVPGLVPDEQTCPGGEFLSEDALVIERDAGGKFPEWITDVDGPVWYQCGGTDDLLQDIFDAVKARADQVGEPG